MWPGWPDLSVRMWSDSSYVLFRSSPLKCLSCSNWQFWRWEITPSVRSPPKLPPSRTSKPSSSLSASLPPCHPGKSLWFCHSRQSLWFHCEPVSNCESATGVSHWDSSSLVSYCDSATGVSNWDSSSLVSYCDSATGVSCCELTTRVSLPLCH